MTESADEFIDKMIQQGIVALGIDFASHGDETVMMKVKIVDGEPVCQQITKEEFYACTTEPIEVMQHDLYVEPQIYIPPQERGHPTSPRKSR